MKQHTATIIAFLTAPLVAETVDFVQGAVKGVLHLGLNADSFQWVLICYVVIGSYVLLLGLPAFFVANHLKMVNLWSCIVVGVVLGLVISYEGRSDPKSWEAALYPFRSNGPIGAFSGSVFWLIWRLGRRNGPPAEHRRYASG